MQVTAREGARGVAARTSEARARSGPLDPTRGEALRLESARQACWPVRQQADGIRDEAPLPVPGSARDLGPARGVMTAVGIGLLLWVAALGTIHALTR